MLHQGVCQNQHKTQKHKTYRITRQPDRQAYTSQHTGQNKRVHQMDRISKRQINKRIDRKTNNQLTMKGCFTREGTLKRPSTMDKDWKGESERQNRQT